MNKYLFGLHDEYREETAFLSPQTYQAFNDLKNEAQKSGIILKVVSGYRSFDKQREIWNAKARGERVLRDASSNPLHFEDLSKEELISAIMRWSALPGFSRHHWGSDFDIIDEAPLREEPDYQVKLTPDEYGENGVFEKLGSFLDQKLSDSPFFRPYERDLGGVAPEPWHLSYAPLSESFLKELHFDVALTFLHSSYFEEVLFCQEIRDDFESIYNRYITNIC